MLRLVYLKPRMPCPALPLPFPCDALMTPLRLTRRSQVYGGISGATDDELALTERARAIVASTQGQVLMFRGEVLQAFYHSTCGGDTVPPSWAFSNSLNHLHQDSAADDEADAGALQGASDCKCGRSK